MRKRTQEHNWWIDVVLFTGYLFCFALDLTGVIGHEWLGLGIGLLGLVHLLVHRKWVGQVLQRFFRGTGGRNRFYLVLDLLLAAGFLGILITGLVISTWLDRSLNDYATWLDIHIVISVAALLVTLLKIGFHWRWVASMTLRIFGTPLKPVRTTGIPVLAPQPVRVDESRRKFLAVMGVVGIGSTLALLNLNRDGELFAAAESDLTSDGSGNPDQTNLAVTSGESTPAVTGSAGPAAENLSPSVTLEDSPTIVADQPTAVACTVRCPRGCSFPGHCRRYSDQNGNGKCDLGECL